MEEQIAKCKNYSFPAHLIEIQQASEQRLKAPSRPDDKAHDLTPGGLEQAEAHQGADGQGAAAPASDIKTPENISNKTLDLLDLYVDAKDSVNNWCAAKIVDHDLQHYKITVHFDGWSAKYDDSMRINSGRLAPFRKYTQGYTGQKSVALRDFNLNYAYQVTLLNKIEQVIQSSFRSFADANECTQFIRGELYLYFDSLITLPTYASPTDIEKIFSFTRELFKLCLKWIELFPQSQEAYKNTQQYPNLYLVDLDAAICSCGYEIFDMIHKCFGLCSRASKFCHQFRLSMNYQSEYCLPEQMPTNGLMLSLVNQFGDLGGFKILLDVIQVKDEEEGGFKCPISVACHVAQTFTKLPDLGVKPDFASKIAGQLAESIQKRLQPAHFTDAEIKGVHLDQIKLLVRRLALFKSLSSEENRHEVHELWELEVAKRYLMCPFFEMRIKGMKEFKHIQEKIVNTAIHSGPEYKKQNLEFAYYLTCPIYSKWILNNKILEYIFNENSHSELIKRSFTILYIMVQSADTFPEETLQMLWSCCLPEKHEDIIRTTYELITEIAALLPLPRVKFMYNAIKTIPMQSMDAKTVAFLRGYTLATFSNLNRIKGQKEQQEKAAIHTKKAGQTSTSGSSKASDRAKRATVVSAGDKPVSTEPANKAVPVPPSDFEYVDCQIFWDIAQDENKCTLFKTKELALSGLIEVLKQATTYIPNIREVFIEQALENLKSGRTVYFSIKFLQNLLSTYPVDNSLQAVASRQAARRQAQSADTVDQVVANILKGCDLYHVIIELASKYMAEKIVKGASHGSQSEALNEIDSGSKEAISAEDKVVTHEEHIKLFINLIEFLVINSRQITLQLNHVVEMFKIFVTEAVTPIETREFFNFLTKQNQNARSRERIYLLDEKLRLQVFTKIMCNDKAMNCVDLTLQAYECFNTLFKGVNAQEGTLSVDLDSRIQKVTNFVQIQGINTLWKIAVNCKNEEVRDLSRKLLCDIYLQVKSKNQKEIIKIQEQFIKTCRQHLQQAQEQRMKGLDVAENDDTILNCLRLMKTFITRFDKEHMVAELKQFVDNLSQAEQRHMRVVRVKLEPDEVRYEVEVNINCQFWELMRKTASALNLKMSEFLIFTKQGPLPDEMYSYPMKNYDLKEVVMTRVATERMEKEFPSFVIGYSQECLDVFLDVLKNPNDAIASEVIGLIEAIQLSPKIKSYLNERLTQLKVISPEAIQQQEAEHQVCNFKEWSQILTWEKDGPLNQTMYMLTCLRDLTSGKATGSPRSLSKAQEQQIVEERLARAELQQSLITKGGFHFLLFMFSTINKQIDFEKELLTSKTLQLLTSIMDRLHNAKLQPLLQQYEKPRHVKEMIDGSSIIVNSFLKSVNQKQDAKYTEHLTKLISQNNNECSPVILTQAFGVLQTQSFDSNILSSSLNFLNRILLLSPRQFEVLAKTELFEQMLKYGLIEISQRRIQEKIQIFAATLCTKGVEQQLIKEGLPASGYPSFVILSKAIKEFIPLSTKVQNTQKMRTFFKLVTDTLNGSNVSSYLSEIIKPADLVETLIKMVQERKIREATSRDEDNVLAGLFDILGLVLLKFPDVRLALSKRGQLIQFLTHHGLLEKEKRMLSQQAIGQGRAPQMLPPLCKNPSTRKSCLELLRILCLDDNQDKLFLASYLKDTVCNETSWRTPRKVDWSVHVQQQERSLSGFVGLKNLGCICYMNSIFQQLYMIPTFRKAILEVEDRNNESGPEDENVLHQVKCIFGGLMEIEKQYFNPKKFCKAFKDIDGSPIDVFVQKDVDEFFDMLVDRIESLIKGTNQEKVMNNLFRGVCANELICKDCPHYSEREEPFRAISLQVKNKHTVHESLKYYVKGEMLEGDNAYYCEKCEKKVNTLMRCCIKRMPNILFLVLKRFEFDFETMQKIKVNDYCEFPTELDMGPYSQQELARQDLIKMMEEKNLTKEDLNDEQLHALERSMPQNYFKYKLKGIVVHHGTADQGHYYSFIQDREGKNQGWFEFNDTLVREFDPSDIAEEAYGGEDNSIAQNINEMQQQNNGQVDHAMIQAMTQYKNKIRNAYVLIYDRVEMFDMQKVNDVIDDLKSSQLSSKELQKQYQACRIPQNSSTSLPPQIPHNVQDVILAKNQKFWLSKTVFSPTFIGQIYAIFKDFKFGEDKDYNKYLDAPVEVENIPELKAFKFVISFFLTVALRSKDRTVLPDFLALIREALKKNIGICLWLIQMFSSQDFIKEFLIDCPVHDMARFTSGLLKTAMEQVYEKEKESIVEYSRAMQSHELLQSYLDGCKAEIEEEQVVDGKQAADEGELTACSFCSQVRLIKLSSPAVKIPKLVILINAFLHMSTSVYCLARFRMTGQFWSVFSNFSQLGDTARLYLLQTQTLGRLIDILLNISPDNFFDKQTLDSYKFMFRDECLRQVVPLYVFSKHNYLGIDPERGNVQLSSAERKDMLKLISPPRTFLILAISNLARSCTLVNQPGKESRSIFSLGNLNFVPRREEIELLQTHQNIKWWVRDHSKLARNSIAIMFAHVASNNAEFSQDYIRILIQLISQEQSTSIRQYERPLLRLVQLNDKIQPERIKRLLSKLIDLFRGSTQFFIVIEALTEIVVKLSLRCPAFAQSLAKAHADLFKLIDRYYQQYPTLPVGQSKIRIFREGQGLRWNDIKSSFLNQGKLEWITNYVKNRTQKLLVHLKKTPQEQARVAIEAGANDFNADLNATAAEVEADAATAVSSDGRSQISSRTSAKSFASQPSGEQLDPDNDMYGLSFLINQQIDFVLNGMWYNGTVENSTEEMIRCVIPSDERNQQQSTTSHWFELESNLLAPSGSQTKNDKEILQRFYVELSAFVV